MRSTGQRSPELRGRGIGIGACLVLAATALAGPVRVDPHLYSYEKVEGVSGTIKAVGSDTMTNEMTRWAEGFHDLYPNVQVEVEGKGSATAPPALVSGQATFGPMSRPLRSSEQDDFEKVYGYKATALPTSIDMVAVYVNKDNPIDGLSFLLLDAIFSKARKRGYPSNVRTWGDLGLNGIWANQQIDLFGRNAASGTYAFFKEHVLGGGDYKDTVKEQPGSAAVVQAVARDRFAIGYSGIGYRTADVRAIPLAESGTHFFAPDARNAYSGDYPLVRFLFITVNYRPLSRLDPLRREFLKFVLSHEGQEAVVKEGYYPLGPTLCRETLEKVGISWPAE